jgi:NADH-quinone oxidoreductase subunit G
VRGAKVSFINARRYDYLFPVAGYLASNGVGTFEHLAAVTAAAVRNSGQPAPASVASLIGAIEPNDAQSAIAQQLAEGEGRMILLGALAQRDAAYVDLRLLAHALAQVTGATLGFLPEAANTVGAHLAGALPHRAAGGRALEAVGLNVSNMLAARLKAYVVFGAIEPAHDIASPAALEALKAAECVIALSPYATAREFADLILPIGTFAETSGTYVNLEGRWQSAPGAAKPVGESRPGWKVLRVLANLLNFPGFDYTSSDEITEELRRELAQVPEFKAAARTRTLQPRAAAGGSDVRDIPIYQSDAVVRRATSLQNTRAGIEGRGGQTP